MGFSFMFLKDVSSTIVLMTSSETDKSRYLMMRSTSRRGFWGSRYDGRSFYNVFWYYIKVQMSQEGPFPYLFHVLVEEIKDVPLLFLRPVTFHMVIPGAPRHCSYKSLSIFDEIKRLNIHSDVLTVIVALRCDQR